MRNLVLRSFQSPGDIVMMTAAVRDLHLAHPGQFRTDIRTSADALWQHNPYITPLVEGSPGVDVIEMHYALIHESNQRPLHFIHGYAQHLERMLGLRIPVTSFRGDVYLSVEERQLPAPGLPTDFADEDFWIVIAGGKYDFTAKWWDPAGYQSIVDHFEGKIRFVQCGEGSHWHPRLSGVVDLVGKTTLREFIQLMYHAAGVICPVTFAMHLAAAVETRPDRGGLRACIVVAGGREPPHWEAYPQHQFISTVGALNCCRTGGCWKSRCQLAGDGDLKDHFEVCDQPVQITPDLRIAKCMHIIRPDDVIRRIELHFEGGSMRYLDQPASHVTRRRSTATAISDGGAITEAVVTTTNSTPVAGRNGFDTVGSPLADGNLIVASGINPPRPVSANVSRVVVPLGIGMVRPPIPNAAPTIAQGIRDLVRPPFLRVAIPCGIASSVWALTKVPGLLTAYGAEKAHIALCGEPPHRSKPLVERFDFVASVEYSRRNCDADRHRPGPVHDVPLSAHISNDFDWMLAPDRHLASGERIEKWVPEFDTDLRIADRFLFLNSDLRVARKLQIWLGAYCVFCPGPAVEEAVNDGEMQINWGPREWGQLAKYCRWLGLTVVVVGDNYDRPCLERHLRRELGEFHDFVGKWEIGTTLAVIQRAQFFVGSPNGIGVFSVYLDIPTALVGRSTRVAVHSVQNVVDDEQMAMSWSPRDALEARRYLPYFPYRTPEFVAEHASSHSWHKR